MLARADSAAAASWMFRRPLAAPPWPPAGYSVERSRRGRGRRADRPIKLASRSTRDETCRRGIQEPAWARRLCTTGDDRSLAAHLETLFPGEVARARVIAPRKEDRGRCVDAAARALRRRADRWRPRASSTVTRVHISTEAQINMLREGLLPQDDAFVGMDPADDGDAPDADPDGPFADLDATHRGGVGAALPVVFEELYLLVRGRPCRSTALATFKTLAAATVASGVKLSPFLRGTQAGSRRRRGHRACPADDPRRGRGGDAARTGVCRGRLGRGVDVDSPARARTADAPLQTGLWTGHHTGHTARSRRSASRRPARATCAGTTPRRR